MKKNWRSGLGLWLSKISRLKVVRMTADIERGKVGMLFEDFLRELEVCEEATEQAVRRVLEFLRAQEEIKECPERGNAQTA